MRFGNERFGSPIRICQLACHERGEVSFHGLEVDSEMPGKAFASEFTKPFEETISIVLGGQNQPDLHSRIHAQILLRAEILTLACGNAPLRRTPSLWFACGLRLRNTVFAFSIRPISNSRALSLTRFASRDINLCWWTRSKNFSKSKSATHSYPSAKCCFASAMAV